MMPPIILQILKTIIWLAFPVCGLIGWIYYSKARHEERKLWIEQGQNPNDHEEKKETSSDIWLKLGIVVASLGVGLLIITLLINFDSIGHSDAVFPAILCICGGAGLLLAHYLGQRNKTK